MPQAETAVEAAIYDLGGALFARLINPIIIVFVAIAIGLFLYTIFKRFWDAKSGKLEATNLVYPVIGLTIMLSAIGITYFIGNTANEIFQGPVGGGAVKGIGDVVKPIDIR